MLDIKHDFHIHTERSLCAYRDAFATDYIKEAKTMGLKKIGFADHFWDSAYKPLDFIFYEPQNYDHLATIIDEIKNADTEGIDVFFGCEAEYSPEHGVAITEECAEKFDFITVSNSHTHKTMPAEYAKPDYKAVHTEFMVRAYMNILESHVSKYILSMAHPFEAVCCPYDNNILKGMITDDTFKMLFSKTAEKGIAVEINIGTMKQFDENSVETAEEIRMFTIAKEMGCKFVFGSDSHNVHNYKDYYIDKCNMMAKVLSLKDEDILNFVK